MDPAQYPARAARQWIPPSIPPERRGSRRLSHQSGSPVPTEYPAERFASGSRRVSRQSCSPVDPPCRPLYLKGQLPLAREGVSRQISPSILSSSPVDPASQTTLPERRSIARAARPWIPPSIPPELLANGSRPVFRHNGSPVNPAKYPARAISPNIPPYPTTARQWIPPSIPPELLASGSALQTTLSERTASFS